MAPPPPGIWPPQAIDCGPGPGPPGQAGPPEATQGGFRVGGGHITAHDTIPPQWLGPPQVKMQVTWQVALQVTWQVAPHVWTPPHAVTGPQLMRQVWQVAPHVWIPPQCVGGPQVGKQVAPHVWTPPQCVTGPQLMAQVCPQVWTPPQ